MYFKHFPLSGHTNARLAAEGAVAAHQQGKFWAFGDKVWDASDNLTPALLEKTAKDVGLDVALWRKDASSDGVKARVQADKSEGTDLWHHRHAEHLHQWPQVRRSARHRQHQGLD